MAVWLPSSHVCLAGQGARCFGSRKNGGPAPSAEGQNSPAGSCPELYQCSYLQEVHGLHIQPQPEAGTVKSAIVGRVEEIGTSVYLAL